MGEQRSKDLHAKGNGTGCSSFFTGQGSRKEIIAYSSSIIFPIIHSSNIFFFFLSWFIVSGTSCFVDKADRQKQRKKESV